MTLESLPAQCNHCPISSMKRRRQHRVLEDTEQEASPTLCLPKLCAEIPQALSGFRAGERLWVMTKCGQRSQVVRASRPPLRSAPLETTILRSEMPRADSRQPPVIAKNTACNQANTTRFFRGETELRFVAWTCETRGHRKPQKSAGGTRTVPHRDACG